MKFNKKDVPEKQLLMNLIRFSCIVHLYMLSCIVHELARLKWKYVRGNQSPFI